MKATQNLLIAVVLALALGGLGIAMDGQPDEISVMRKVQAEVIALENEK